MSNAHPEKFGKYDVTGVLGEGAMGVVYKGHDPAIGRTVAIKTLHRNLLDADTGEDVLERFRREAQSAGRLNHPGIVTIYDFGEADGIVYLVMECVQGRSVKEIFDSEEGFPLNQIPGVMTMILDALGFAHDQGIVHRDIKPANIMVVEGERPIIKIMDFGIARVESSNLTQVGTAIGTPGYMSPEQFTGSEIDQRSDLFSAGVVLYQLLTGEKPFSGSLTATMHKVLKETPIDPSDLNLQCTPEIDAVVRKALAKRPPDRYQTAADFVADIERAFAGKPVSAAADDDATQKIATAADDDATVAVRAAPPPDDDATVAVARAAPSDDDATVAVATAAPTPQPSAPTVSPSAPAASAAKAASPMPKIAAAIAVGVIAMGGAGWFLMQDDAPAPEAAVQPQQTAPASSAPAKAEPQETASAPPAPLKPAASELGTVAFVTSPPGARISKQDGTLLGVTPLDVSLPPGEYELILSKDGYHDVSASVEVATGDRIPFEVEMTAK